MGRIPEPLPERDRLQMIRWKQQGLSYDDITSRFAGRYTRGKIVGEITRAENTGEFQASGTVNKQTFVPVIHRSTQALQTQSPGFVIVNPPPIPQPYVYQPVREPTIIFTQPPHPPQKPFDIVKYMFKKTIDAAIARLAAPQVSTQTTLTQDQINRTLALQRQQQEQEEEQRREKEEKARIEQERERADRVKALEEQRKGLQQMEETARRLMAESRRKEQDSNEEFVGLIRKQTTDTLNRTGV